ncbi:hypothetical protein [Actinophytocola gossypii]|uniref:HpcH/HpaI aldolase/citrate lyase domain-containing protein n=1 Tax=Actinophytocola gossypii TaxID=2812003 RepID=A0ABT2JCJ5_9PSEU|nr:hypothetical protein [Actinophytocola gossypii]MCT2585587.1 hypothetical protein [Actinophytocola gossypii]
MIDDVPGIRARCTRTTSSGPGSTRWSPGTPASTRSTCTPTSAGFPPSEPDGYRAPNDTVLDAAAHDHALVPFCRLAPGDHPDKELARCLDGGAAGVKLHPASDDFILDDDELTDVSQPVRAGLGPGRHGRGDRAHLVTLVKGTTFAAGCARRMPESGRG